MLTWECQPDDIPTKLVEEGLEGMEWRFLAHHHVRREADSFRNRWLVQSALQRGWHQENQGGSWFPIDFPLPLLRGMPINSTVKLSLSRICHGITWELTAGDVTISDTIDELDDFLELWVRFVNILAGGGFPHAALSVRTPTHFVIQDGGSSESCRLFVRHCSEDEKVIDLIVARKDLTQQFSSFLVDVSNHPCLGHSYLFCGSLPDDLYEAADAAAQAEWEAGVKDGRHLDDFDAEMDFVERRIAADVPLPDHLLPVLEKTRTMLQTLVIPEEWLEW